MLPSMNLKDAAALIIVSALWGGSFLLMRIAVPNLGPVVVALSRVLIAGIVLALFCRALGIKLELRRRWQHYLILGVLNGALPFTLISAAELHLTASVAVILNATTPIFGVFFAAFWGVEAFTIRRFFGLCIGVFGVGILVGWNPAQPSIQVYLSVVASLVAAAAYGLAGVSAKATVRGISAFALAAGSQLSAAVILLPLLPFVPIHSSVSGTVVVCVIVLALLCTAVARVLHFQLIARVGPTTAALTTYLAPIFGILWEWLFLTEVPQVGMLIGLTMILGSLTLISGAVMKTVLVQENRL
jgi:drug/metabolite transporter (DMT)-like permease